MVDGYCIGCDYLDTDLVACVYILQTGRSRAFSMKQPAGTGCTCREAGNSKRGQRAVISDEIRACMIQKYEKDEQRRESIKRLHADGLTDTQIARETGCTVSAVKRWRKVNSLPANMHLAYLPNNGIVKLRLSGTGDDKELLEHDMDERLQDLLPLLRAERHQLRRGSQGQHRSRQVRGLRPLHRHL